ncbi:FAD/NAD(P)-binding oxidoreductase family protein [Actinidia rufa]|uniref:Squalene monooxygenase n=1 Tax=Actinidia rufa TaxID=165716 RepID=A0A7J0GH39_9ERIC|nr:FAD/NAD(P)-binding oxidoreductase family protein [Actinidia rufa]
MLNWCLGMIFSRIEGTPDSYPLEKFHSDVSGRSFHNGRFIQRMREKVTTLPDVRLEHGTVTILLEENGTIKGAQYKTKTGEELTAYAPLTIVCDGCFSNLRRSLCKPKVDAPSCFVGLVLENCNLPYGNHGHGEGCHPPPVPGPPDHPHSCAGNKVIATFLSAIEFEDIM